MTNIISDFIFVYLASLARLMPTLFPGLHPFVPA